MPKKITDKTEKTTKTTKAAEKPVKVAKKVTTPAPAPAAAKPTKPTASPKTSRGGATKSVTIKKFQRSANDTGSTAVQIAVLSEKIAQLSNHLGEHKKDNDSRMGLLKMISHRRGLLSYLEKKEPEEYRKLLATLGLRK